MLAHCPKCQTQLTVETKHFDEDTAIVCSGCRSILKTKLTVEVLSESTRPSHDAAAVAGSDPQPPRSIDAKKVLIAIDGEGTRDFIKEILSQGGFEVLEASSREEILSELKRRRPATVLIDVGLPDNGGPQICGAIKGDPLLKDTIVILVTSIYEKTEKYRRAPASLFGAEDYIERHLIEKDLLSRMEKHLSAMIQAKAETPAVGVEKKIIEKVEKAPSAPLRSKAAEPSDDIDWKAIGDASPTASPASSASAGRPSAAAPQESKEREDAKRLARIIVSDIVLYNKKKVDEGIRTGSFFEILREEIEEGRTHYNSRVSSDLQKSKDFYREALEDFIKKRKEVM